jgi:ATPase family AAA domain-containing protein 3A/B
LIPRPSADQRSKGKPIEFPPNPQALRRAAIDGEEKRKTMQAQEEQERRTQQYKAQLESELYQHKLEDQQKQNEEWIAQQHQQFLRQEEIRKRNDFELEEAKRRNMQEQVWIIYI